jgi:hypothetical protein
MSNEDQNDKAKVADEDKPVLHTRQLINSIDAMLLQASEQYKIDYCDILGALAELTSRFQFEQRAMWANMEMQRQQQADEEAQVSGFTAYNPAGPTMQ